MSEKLGLIKYGELEETKHLGYIYGGGREYSEEVAKLIDQEVKELVDNAYKDAKEILISKKKYVEKLVEKLLKQEVVSGQEFEEMFKE